jgi:hypothetical protein
LPNNTKQITTAEDSNITCSGNDPDRSVVPNAFGKKVIRELNRYAAVVPKATKTFMSGDHALKL